MPLSMDNLKKLLDEKGFRYYLDPERSAVLAAFSGILGSYQIVFSTQVNDTFLQLRTVNYLKCPDGHSSLGEVLKVIAALNLQHRLVKYAWDVDDGEIVVTADHWVMDTSVTSVQFNRIVQNFLPTIDGGYDRLKRTIETGVDPGPMSPEEFAAKLQEVQGKGPGGTKPEKEKITEI